MSASRPGGVLALDLASRVGWAYGCPGDRQPLCGAWILPPSDAGDHGRKFAAMENELEDLLVIYRPVLILVEAPLPPTAVSNASTWAHQLGLSAIAASSAYRHDIRFRQQAASTIRLEILGTCRFPGGDPKDAIMDYCAGRGWTVPNHDAGDACITWLYGCHHLNDARAWRVAA
jgi:hypothetical protein